MLDTYLVESVLLKLSLFLEKSFPLCKALFDDFLDTNREKHINSKFHS